jgi:predicted transcriptional regulator of viral defense system
MKQSQKVGAISAAQRIIRKQGGIIRTSEAIAAGVHPRTLYQLRDDGVIEQLSRGVFRLADHSVSDQDLVTVATRIPHAIICLVSALAFHELTTQIPHTVSIALKKGAESPRLFNPPLTIYRFSDESLNVGIDSHNIDEVIVNVYNVEKTIADCFKFRNKVGMDVALEDVAQKLRQPFHSKAHSP